ncbi:ADP-ribose pyrophosphatase [Planctomycetales bacterium 10988]|nr:ADP-ribose pyrophosphatase [Planctomycetales bacterium 10988]
MIARPICDHCGFIHYLNPKLIVGAVSTWKNQILLCRRAIEPRRGFWTIPAGFMELNETSEQGAARETWEEATAKIQVDFLLATYSLPHISQVHLLYAARLLNSSIKPGEESLEVGLFSPDEIPWSELAFPTVDWVLKYYLADPSNAFRPPMSTPQTYLSKLENNS